MKEDDLKKVLEDHRKWLDDEEGGIRADLRGADLRYAYLRGADLKYADLRGADLKYADLSNADLKKADLRYADLENAYLSGTDLKGANLSNADLRYADLDFSVFPLWCGSFDMRVDDRFMVQLVCHLTRLKPDGEKGRAIQKALFKWRNDFCEYREDVDKI